MPVTSFGSGSMSPMAIRDIADTAVVAVRPTPCVIAGQLSPAGAGGVPMDLAEYGCTGFVLGGADRHGAPLSDVEAATSPTNHALTIWVFGLSAHSIKPRTSFR